MTLTELQKVVEPNDLLFFYSFNGKKDFALLGERTRILNEIGLIIELEYEGKFENFMKQSHYDIPNLVRMIL